MPHSRDEFRSGRRRRWKVALAVGLLVLAPWAKADFAAAVSPPRFELAVLPGDTTRQVIELHHSGAGRGVYRFYTLDWTMADDGNVSFSEGLQPGSCRPWFALERHEISLSPGERMRYRVELRVPPDAPAGECRLAVMIEGAPDTVQAGAAAVPMSGRVGVMVYVRIGDVRPAVRVEAWRMADVQGQSVPQVRLANTGQSTARPAGFLKARDSQGKTLELSPDGVPILPGQARWVALMPVPAVGFDGQLRGAKVPSPPPLVLPLTVEGTLEIGPVEPALKLPVRADVR